MPALLSCPRRVRGSRSRHLETQVRKGEGTQTRYDWSAELLVPLSLAHYHEEWTGWPRCRESECGKVQWDRWLCTHRTKVRNEDRHEPCGAAYYFRRPNPYQVGGPRTRALDRRYAFGYNYKCKHTGTSMLRHESAPDPDQPAQDPILKEQIEALKVVAKATRKKRAKKSVPA